MFPISRLPRRSFKPTILAVTLVFCANGVGRADFDEIFDDYSEGDLLGQQDWAVQGIDGDGQTYITVEDRVEVQSRPERKTKVIVWLPGHSGIDQTRIVKRFPETSGTMVEISFALNPGDPEAGKFSFEQTDGGASFRLRFIRGTVEYISPDSPAPIDTKVNLSITDWNDFHLQLNFETHTMQFFLNGNLIGDYTLPSGMTGLDQVNFFGGGDSFESALSDLKVTSVSSFSK